MKRVDVEGYNGSWCFAFSTRVKHGNGTRKVEISVPVLQLLELADQFRACAGGPAHTVYHSRQMKGGSKTCKRQASVAGERFFFCESCRCPAREMDVCPDRLPDLRCPTCSEPGLVEAELLGTCSECDRQVPLSPNGRVAIHMEVPGVLGDCSGAGQLPAGVTA